MPKALQGMQVVVTRPVPQAHGFRQRLAQAGATAIAFPVLSIQAAADLTAAQRAFAQLSSYDIVVFISTNAVDFGLALLDNAQQSILKQQGVGAIGKKTAQALHNQGVPVRLVPEQGYTSEDLLALSALQDLTQQRVLIVRGQGGREVLADTLRQRGAVVDYADVYQRICPTVSPDLLKQHHDQQPLGIIAITSGEGLQNLLVILENPDWIKNVPLLVGSRRMADLAKQVGFKGALVIADDPGDEAMFTALAQWAQETNEHDR